MSDAEPLPSPAPEERASGRSGPRLDRRLVVLGAVSLLTASGITMALLRASHGFNRPAASGDDADNPAVQLAQTAPRIFTNPSTLEAGAMVKSMSNPIQRSEPYLAFPIAQARSALTGDGTIPAIAPVRAAADAPAPGDALMVDVPQNPGERPAASMATVKARRAPEQSLLLAAGSVIGCALETAIDSSRGGFVTCSVTDQIVSDDGRTILIERGSHVLGEYHADAKLGDARIAILWNRLRKSDGTVVDLVSPGVDPEGRSGVAAGVDNHWFTRIGAAFLLSVIEDGVSAASVPRNGSGTIVLGNSANAGTALSQKVLDASINIAPSMSVNAGARISILVAKDIDFGEVYAAR